ncbi:hypothetical protein [Sphaerisporangium aureirubrum]|uniref:Transcriptional regulator n=1 Tax=Sphaerisporangium aureirubrum TaxID=1544736 RepID=A0ABW1NL58_9ACTN
MLSELIGVHPLDVYTLAGGGAHVEEGLDRLLSAPAYQVSIELDTWGCFSRLPIWTGHLPDDAGIRKHFAAAVQDMHAALVAPYRDPIRAHLEAEVASRGRTMAREGAERMLSTLHPDLVWGEMTLTVPTRFTTMTVEVHLGGRGLVLVPSIFCRLPLASFDDARPDGPPVLFYPALRDPAHAFAVWGRRTSASSQTKVLAALLGETRGRWLRPRRWCTSFRW